MKRMPLLTSGRVLVARGDIKAPIDDDGSDWAELTIVEVNDIDASLLGSYWSSGHQAFLGTGNVDRLKPFEGELVNGLPVMTDPGLIEEFDEQFGYVDVREIYEQAS
ncbi:MAG TPA: hypothetical protein VFB41_07660 [Solirubrobacteraceae bacterium]|nr:hypothetical protein [Solirubrobacteraceae bacterium]